MENQIHSYVAAGFLGSMPNFLNLRRRPSYFRLVPNSRFTASTPDDPYPFSTKTLYMRSAKSSFSRSLSGVSAKF